MRPSPLAAVLLLALPLLCLPLFTDTPAEAGRGDEHAKRLPPKEEALVELGRRLFFDPLVSRSGRRSCASCHDPDHGFSDPGRVSDDDIGRTRRHSQTLLDGAHNPSAHWDGEFETIEELVLARIGAVKGRKGKLGHGSTLLDAVSQSMLGGDEVDTDVFDDREAADEDVIDDGDGEGGGGDDDVYHKTPSSDSSASEPKARGPATKSEGGAAAPAKPAEGKVAEEAPAPKPEPKPKKAKGGEAKKDDAAKADAAAATKKPTLEQIRARAIALRADLQRLPLAADVLERGGFYAAGFQAAFGNRRVSTERIARAIAAYCRSIESTTAPYDRYAAGDKGALPPAAVRGLDLFRGKAGCVSCHTMDGEHPLFTDFAFHNTGVVWDRMKPAQRERWAARGEDIKRKRDGLERRRGPDKGRARVSTLKRDLRSFKTATLRDLGRRGPYMHDGRFATLDAVVRYYAQGGGRDPVQSAHVQPVELSDAEVTDLVAFLGSLNGDKRPGLPTEAWRERRRKARLRFVDAEGRALAGLEVRLTPVGDLAAREMRAPAIPATLTTDRKGWIVFAPSIRTHTRITLPGALAPRDGALVPDSCEKARVVVPVRGKAEVVIRFPPGVVPPAVLVAEHQGTILLPGHTAPRTRLERSHVIGTTGARTARYAGWFRTDVPPTVRLRLPGADRLRAEVTLDPQMPARLDASR